MNVLYIIIIYPLLNIYVYVLTQSKVQNKNTDSYAVDTAKINELNRLGYNIRLTDPEQTLNYADKALKKATEIKYTNGIAEALRIKGIAKYSINQNESAIEHYLNALTYFKQSNDQIGEAKVYNNIGILYRDLDYDKSFEYFEQALKLSEQLNISDLTAGLYLNMGTLYQKKKNYNKALTYFKQSIDKFTKLNIPAGIVSCLQNTGVTYFKLNQLDQAEKYLLEAIEKAKEHDLNVVIASTNLTLTSIYIAKENFIKAEQTLKEGSALAELLKDTKLQYDYLYTSYELEFKRKNYHQALSYLQKVYKQDSIIYKNNVSDKIGLLQEQYRQREKQRETELFLLAQKNNRIMLWATTLIALLLLVLIILLSFQKENLDRINHHLEEIIDKRTKDLQIKNKKLSEYSSHLSHQIRGPVATLKGLMILNNDKLIEPEECLNMIQHCVNEIDEKIIKINETLNDTDQLPSNPQS
jgi:tetratricopeptide (TPR) repeat protein